MSSFSIQYAAIEGASSDLVRIRDRVYSNNGMIANVAIKVGDIESRSNKNYTKKIKSVCDTLDKVELSMRAVADALVGASNAYSSCEDHVLSLLDDRVHVSNGFSQKSSDLTAKASKSYKGRDTTAKTTDVDIRVEDEQQFQESRFDYETRVKKKTEKFAKACKALYYITGRKEFKSLADEADTGNSHYTLFNGSYHHDPGSIGDTVGTVLGAYGFSSAVELYEDTVLQSRYWTAESSKRFEQGDYLGGVGTFVTGKGSVFIGMAGRAVAVGIEHVIDDTKSLGVFGRIVNGSFDVSKHVIGEDTKSKGFDLLGQGIPSVVASWWS